MNLALIMQLAEPPKQKQCKSGFSYRMLLIHSWIHLWLKKLQIENRMD